MFWLFIDELIEYMDEMNMNRDMAGLPIIEFTEATDILYAISGQLFWANNQKCRAREAQYYSL